MGTAVAMAGGSEVGWGAGVLVGIEVGEGGTADPISSFSEVHPININNQTKLAKQLIFVHNGHDLEKQATDSQDKRRFKN